MLDVSRTQRLPRWTGHRARPVTTSPWPAMVMVLSAATIVGTISWVIWQASGMWMWHGFVTLLLVIAAGMAVGSRENQRRGRKLTASLMGYSLGLALLSLMGVGFIGLVAVIFLFTALLLWPHEPDETPFDWTVVRWECLGFAAFMLPLLVLLPTTV